MYSSSIILSAVMCLSVYQCVPTGYGDGGLSLGSTSYGGGSGGGYHEEQHEPKPYAFGYAVKDFKKGTDFNQHESSDGHNVHGQYTVQLPDGRTQIVSYKADWKNGYNAEIKYVGEAHHPEIYAQHESYGDFDHGSSGGSYGSGHGASSSNFQALGGGHGGSSHGGYESQGLHGADGGSFGSAGLGY